MKARWLGVGLATGLLSLAAMNFLFMGGNLTEKTMATGIGDVDTLLVHYDRWKEGYQKHIGPEKFVMGFGYAKGLSSEFSKGHGKINVDLTKGEVAVYAYGLPEESAYDVWLIDNQDGSDMGVRPDAQDRMMRLGRLAREKESWSLETMLNRDELRGFEIDLVAVTKAEIKPEDGSLLVGMPSLFQKVFYNELRQPQFLMANLETIPNDEAGEASAWMAPFRALVPAPAYAGKDFRGKYFGKKKVGKKGLDYLVRKGEDLFLNGTFKGNGRTCGTCHSPKNNFTIDEKFIASLPKSDKLFIAEHQNDNLDLDDLEKPELMRRFSLIVENVDGLPQDGGPDQMRSTPHTFALNTSMNPGPDMANVGIGGALGWSGDGSFKGEADGRMFGGDLRSFAVGATIQHFTRCLPRKFDGTCFRIPSDYELDAMEAFQRSLGRQYDPVLDYGGLKLKGWVPTLGQRIYTCDGKPNGEADDCHDQDVQGKKMTVPAGKCNLCHFNGGGNVAPDAPLPDDVKDAIGTNANINTGVELEQVSHKLYQEHIMGEEPACDGGFGKSLGAPCGPFGSSAFNTPTVIEAPDSAPYWHNNAAQTLRGVLAFYNGGAFNVGARSSTLGDTTLHPGDFGIFNFGEGAIALDAPEIDAVAQFIEVLNALENIRNSLSIEKRALYAGGKYRHKSLKMLIEVAYADTEDAYQVLDKVPEHYKAKIALKKAGKYLKKAAKTPVKYLQKKLIYKAMEKQRYARNSMCEYGSDKVLCSEPKKKI